MLQTLAMDVIVHSFASALPPRVVTNNDLSELMDTSDEWITTRTGIKQRHWVTAPQTTSDLGVLAAKQTIELGGAPDLIIAATISPDFSFPGIGVQIQDKLGLPTIPAFDIRNQCSGFLYALDMAAAFVRAERYQRVLIVCAEVQSTGLDISTRGRDMAVLFGDGAGSCIVEAKSSKQNARPQFTVLDVSLGSDGSHLKDLWCEHPGSAHFPTRVTSDLLEGTGFFPAMNGRRVFEHAIATMTSSANQLLTKHELSAADVSLFIPHQANKRINSMVAEQLGITDSAVVSTIEIYGNTTAATIPMGFAHAINDNRAVSGGLVLSTSFGSGFTWGAALLRVV